MTVTLILGWILPMLRNEHSHLQYQFSSGLNTCSHFDTGVQGP